MSTPTIKNAGFQGGPHSTEEDIFRNSQSIPGPNAMEQAGEKISSFFIESWQQVRSRLPAVNLAKFFGPLSNFGCASGPIGAGSGANPKSVTKSTASAKDLRAGNSEKFGDLLFPKGSQEIKHPNPKTSEAGVVFGVHLSEDFSIDGIPYMAGTDVFFSAKKPQKVLQGVIAVNVEISANDDNEDIKVFRGGEIHFDAEGKRVVGIIAGPLGFTFRDIHFPMKSLWQKTIIAGDPFVYRGDTFPEGTQYSTLPRSKLEGQDLFMLREPVSYQGMRVAHTLAVDPKSGDITQGLIVEESTLKFAEKEITVPGGYHIRIRPAGKEEEAKSLEIVRVKSKEKVKVPWLNFPFDSRQIKIVEQKDGKILALFKLEKGYYQKGLGPLRPGTLVIADTEGNLTVPK